MALSAGSRLGPYEIVAPLGAGGMGEVYRARDSRLGREVAVKVLPAHLSAAAEVRARFEREARTVSSLNHPHICVLHDVGREGATDYLVMELVEGETLGARLARGPLPGSEVLKLGAQVADALDRAHRAGVIHRDLKPGNIMLTKSGAKLMDFGLARATGLGGASSGVSVEGLTQSPTMAQPLTAEGTIVGTFQYMAPEQLEGKEADDRSDLWALGCVLYEMATGKRAFEGKSQASLITSIMGTQPPPISQAAPLSPPGLERLVNQCLEKDPDERWQSAGDVRRELQWIAGASSQTAIPRAAARRPVRVPAWASLAAGVLVAGAALGFAFGPWSGRGTPPPLVRFTLGSPPGFVLNTPAEAELSPDGRMIAFTASDSGGTNHLFLRALANPEAREITGTDKANLPFWSPDGRTLGFFAGAKLEKVALDGSPPVVLCDAPDARGGAWSPGGVIVFSPGNQGPLFRVSADGGAPAPLTRLDPARHERSHRYPQFLPDGRHLLYVAIGASDEVTTYATSIDGGAPAEICRAGSIARFVPPASILYLDSGVLSPHRRVLERHFDPGRLRASGDARLVLDEVRASNFGYSNLSTDGRGTLVAQHWSDPHTHLVWRDRHGGLLGVAVEDLDTFGGALSPDGRRLAYSGANPPDLYVRDLTTGIATRLTFESQPVGNIVWSFDGRSIAFARLYGSRGWEARRTSADGTGPDSLVFHGPGLFNYPQSWSRDGRWLAVLCVDSSGTADLWKVPMAGGGAAEIYQRTRGEERSAALSPDGRWIAYVSAEDNLQRLYVQSFPNPGAKYQVAVDDPAGVAWGDRGDELLVFQQNNDIVSVRVSTVAGFQQGGTTRLFKVAQGDFAIDVERGEQRFLVATPIDISASSRLEVVMNWPALLEKK